MNTPVAIFIFNRPEKTARVFEAIRQVRPEKLLVVADGARNEQEWALCDATRAITENIDWPCEVKRNYAEKNMSCHPRMASGISWVFENVDQAILLEDDCLPHPDFFRFCAELLERYKNDTRVMHISGDNFQQGNPSFKCDESYYFSVIPQIQGWATWKRAWSLYDWNLSAWPAFEKSDALEEIFPDMVIREHWRHKFRGFYQGTIPSWDGRWAFACVFNRGYAIDPKVNLISNIGYGTDGTNTKTIDLKKGNLPVHALEFPLVHPTKIEPNENADAYEAKYYRGINLRWQQRVVWFARLQFPKTYNFIKRLVKRS